MHIFLSFTNDCSKKAMLVSYSLRKKFNVFHLKLCTIQLVIYWYSTDYKFIYREYDIPSNGTLQNKHDKEKNKSAKERGFRLAATCERKRIIRILLQLIDRIA